MEYIIVFIVVMALLGLIVEYWYIVLIVFIGYIIWKKSEIEQKDSGFSSSYIPLSVRNTLIQISSKYSEKEKAKLIRELKKCTKINTKEAKNAVEVYFSDKDRFISDTRYAESENLIGDHGFLTNPVIKNSNLDFNNVEKQNNFNLEEFCEKSEDNEILEFDYELMNGWQFEEFCAKVLKNNNYSNVSVTSGSGDFGADLIAYKDGKKYVIQCKNYSGKVGNRAIQEIFSAKAYYKADIAVVMTNNYFTDHAIEHANGTNVVLWNKDILDEMISKIKIESSKEYEKAEEKSEKEAEKVLYDKEKGIYPAGRYIVGEDIEVGSYILVSKSNEEGEVYVYKNSDKKEEIVDDYFEGAYYLSLREKGNLLIVKSAHIQKI